MTDRNVGKFRISSQVILDDPDYAAELFAMLKLVVVRCECLGYSSQFEYVALSPQFAEVPHGYVIPEYTIKVTQREPGVIHQVEALPYN